MKSNLEIKVRAGTPEDVPLLLSFINLLAEYEKLEVQTTEENLRRLLFSGQPAAYSLFAFINDTPAAYAVYYFTFSTMVGKRSLWLEDLFVKPEYRGRGIGRALIAHVAEIAVENDCGRFEWTVLDWNKTAINFYQKLGATIQNDWRLCRIEGTKIAEVAKLSLP